MFEIIGMIVSAICFLVGFVMIALFIATKSEYFSAMIVRSAYYYSTVMASDDKFELFIQKLRDYRNKEKLNK